MNNLPVWLLLQDDSRTDPSMRRFIVAVRDVNGLVNQVFADVQGRPVPQRQTALESGFAHIPDRSLQEVEPVDYVEGFTLAEAFGLARKACREQAGIFLDDVEANLGL